MEEVRDVGKEIGRERNVELFPNLSLRRRRRKGEKKE